MPDFATLEKRAESIAMMAVGHSSGARCAMIGGAPFFMAKLEYALLRNGIRPLYAFSKRESVERVKEDGSVSKINVFRHAPA